MGNKQINRILMLGVVLILSLATAQAARLPVVGEDQNQWGTLLNEYLLVSHTPGGYLSNFYVNGSNITFEGVTYNDFQLILEIGDPTSDIVVTFPNNGGEISLLGQTIESGEITNGTILTADIANDAVTASKIAANAVGASEIGSGVVSSDEIADNSITDADIANGTITIGGTGTPITGHLSATGTVGNAGGNINSLTCATDDIAVSGATTGSTVVTGPPNNIESGLVWGAYVSAVDTVTVRLCNPTGSAIASADKTWRVDIWKH